MNKNIDLHITFLILTLLVITFSFLLRQNFKNEINKGTFFVCKNAHMELAINKNEWTVKGSYFVKGDDKISIYSCKAQK